MVENVLKTFNVSSVFPSLFTNRNSSYCVFFILELSVLSAVVQQRKKCAEQTEII